MHAIGRTRRKPAFKSLVGEKHMRSRLDSILWRLIRANYCTSARRLHFLRFALPVLAVALCLSGEAIAQQATIVGTVTDPSGASLPHVNITVTNTESGAVKNVE